MAVDGHLNFDTRIDTKGFSKGITSIKSMLGGIATAVGVAFSVGALVTFGKQAVQLASDMQEVQNVVDTAFGDMAHKMEEFADTSIRMYGISKLAAKQTGSSFMAMAKGMQMATDTAAEMSISLTALSADMASFYNKRQEDVKLALSSVFTGETETLKQYGILITEVNLQEYARQQGITKSISAMTQAEKVMLRYNYVMQATALAQGDFARTSGGWANQIRILSEQWKEFSSIVGSALMNIALPAVRSLNNALSQLIGYANTAYNALANFFGWEQVQSNATGVTSAIAASVDEQNALTDAVNATAKAQENALAGFDKINKLSSADAGTGGSVAAPAVSTQPVLQQTEQTAGKMENILSGIAKNVDFTPLLASLERLKQAAQPIVGHIGDGFKWLYDNVLVPLGKWTIEEALPASIDRLSASLEFLDACVEAAKPHLSWLWENVLSPAWEWTGDAAVAGLRGLWDALTWLSDRIKENPDIFKPLLEKAAPVIQSIRTMLSDFWTKCGKPIFDNLKSAASGWITNASNAWNTIGKPIFDKIAEVFGNLWRDHVQPFSEKALDFIGKLINSALEIYNGFIIPVSGWIIDNLGPAFTWLAEEVLAYTVESAGYLIDAAGNIIDALGGLVDFITGVFTGDWKRAWNGIKTNHSNIFKAIGNIVLAANRTMISHMKNAVTGIKNAFTNIGSWFDEKFTAACDNVKSAFNSIGTWFTDRYNDIKNVFSGVGSWFSTQFQTAYDNVTGIFDDIDGYFDGIWQNLSSGAKDGINWLIDKLDSLGTRIETLLNRTVDALNKALSFSVPDHVPGIGGTSFGLNLSHVDIPPIPRLATGTVVPANFGEFLAVLGDNKREAEIVSPISAMEKAMENVLSRRGTGDGDIHLLVTLDGKTVYKTIVKKNNESIRMTGKNPLAPTKGVTT